MAHWKTEKYAEHLKKNHESRATVCRYDECPRFSRCEMIPAQGMLFASSKAHALFVTDTVSEDEADLHMPAVNPAGRLLREAMIAHVLTQKKIPFLITKLFRAYIGDKQPRSFESKLCFSHFLKEVKQNQPKLVVALGIGVFNALYTQAINKMDLPSKEEHKISKMRGKFFDFHFDDGVKVKVLITHSPGAVMQTPALYKLFKEDAQIISEFFLTGGEISKKASFKVERIDKLETVKDVFEYLDFLRYGLKEPSIIAFDTETRNLNRRYNNAFLTWQFSHAEGIGVSFPIHHRDKPLFIDPKLQAKLVEKMHGLLNATQAETNINWFVGHNIKFDLGVLWGLLKIIPRDPRVNVPWWCTMLAAHWLDENRKGLKGFLSGSPFSLKTFGVEFFNFYFEEEALDRRGDGALEELTLDQLYTYGGTDSVLTRAIAFHQIKVLAPQEPNNATATLKKFVKHYYFPTSVSLAVLECNGIYVKSDHLSYLQSEDSPVWNRMNEIEHKMQNLPEVLEFRNVYKDKIGGKVKNASQFEANLWGSGDEIPLLDLNKQDVQRLFYLDYLRLPPLKFSKKTGEPTLNSRFLEQYSKPAVYRDSFKIKESFLSYYGEEIGRDEKDGTPLYNENPLQLEGEYRKLKKLGTAYLDGMEGYLRDPNGDCVDSRVRASYNAHGTDTGRLCVAKGTLVSCVVAGSYPIEEVMAGDLVYCYDDLPALQIRKVVWAGKTGHKNVVRIHFTGWLSLSLGGGHLDVTPEHKVRLVDGSYVEARKLDIGQHLLGPSYQVVTALEYLEEPVDVYDLEVEGEHNFIASEICVHNSSSRPNLQQLPGRGKVAKVVKNMFQAEPPSDRFPQGTILLQGDYKTAEVRWGAIFAKDTNLIKVFQDSAKLITEACNNDDISDEDFQSANLMADLHRRTASLMFGMPADKVTDVQRQNSKCILGSSLLYTDRGILPISSLVTDLNDDMWVQPVFGTNTASISGSVEIVAVNHKWVEETICLESALGTQIEGDEDHPLLVWKDCRLVEMKMKDIALGDYLVISRENDIWSKTSPAIPRETTLKKFPKQMSSDLACILGHFAAGENLGCIDKSLEMLKDFQRGVASCFGVDLEILRLPIQIKNFLLDISLGKATWGTRRVPPIIFCSQREEVIDFLRAYYAGDCLVNHNTIITTSTSKLLLEDIQQLLLNLGIISTQFQDPRGYYYALRITLGDSIKFAKIIGFTCPNKNERASRPLTTHDARYSIYGLETHAYLTPVVKKTLHKERVKVYDIEVKDARHTFVTNGFYSKNCITFGLMFGMTTKTLAENNGWTVEEAEDKLARYFSAFPELERWLKRIPEIAKQKGYVETFMGRRRRLKHFLEMGKLADSWKHLSEGERKAMNTSIQGQSSDGGTIGVFTFIQYIFDHNLEERWLVENVVHDSCLVQVPWEDAKIALAAMSQCFVKDMQDYIEAHWGCHLPIEIAMEFEIGLKYGALEKWDGRKKSLDNILNTLENAKEETWRKSTAPKKPPKSLDFVTFHGA